MPYYNQGYTRVKSARSFKPSALGFKSRPFKKSYKRHHRSSNSSTTSKGRFFKLVQLKTFKLEDFVGQAGTTAATVTGFIVLSTHAPVVSGPTPVTTASGIGLKSQFLPNSVAFLKTFQNCYLSKIKVTPLMNYSSDLKLVFEKNNVPLTSWVSASIPYLSQPQTSVVHSNSIDTSKLIITGPGTVKSYSNKSSYSPDWLFFIKTADSSLNALNTDTNSLCYQNNVIVSVLLDGNSHGSQTFTLRMEYDYVCYG